MRKPFFSVITPSWNQGAFLETCIESVLAQGDSDFEHFIYDNCSTDETAAIAAKYPHVRFVSEPDRGQAHAVNKGFAAARGEIICWLNADDAYPPGVFAKLREVFADLSMDVVFGDAAQVAYDGRDEARAPGRFESRLDLVRWWSPAVKLHQPAVFFRRSLAAQVGALREDMHYAMDYEFWWRLSERSHFHYISEVLAIQHRQPDSKTVRAWHKVYAERERVFAPFYGLIDGGNRAALIAEKRNGMADRYLLNAYAAAAFDRRAAWENLRRAWGESPRRVLRLRNLGLGRALIVPTC